VLSAYGREYWLRYPAPVAGDTAWARVVEPEYIKHPPTLIFLHGIAMENEMWRGSADLVNQLALEGIRVIKPEPSPGGLVWRRAGDRPGPQGLPRPLPGLDRRGLGAG
jgi:pimeloyl-ACP methyl ester carboxylesterase